MANIRKKVLNIWDGGIKTSPRDNNPDTSDGAQMIKGFDIFKDKKKLVPTQSWESFTTDAEKAYGIRAMGGLSDTVYGLGKALKGWYGADWLYRLKITVAQQHHLANMPLWLDMSLLPNDFWANVNDDMSDVRITGPDGQTSYNVYTENVDTVAKTGDMWIKGSAVSQGTPTITQVNDFNGTGSGYAATNTVAGFAHAIPLTLTGLHWNAVKINLKKVVATPGIITDVICELFTDNAGAPGTFVQELGRIDIDSIDTITRDFTIATDDISLTGSYWLVFYTVTADASNYIQYTYSSSGSISIYAGTNAGHTTWSVHDDTATPNYELLNIIDASAPVKYFYIYYGNADATVVPYGSPSFDYLQGGRGVFTENNLRWYYTFGGESLGNRYYNDADSGTEAFTTEPQTFLAGLFGKAIRTFGTDITTNHDDEVALNGNDISFSFLINIAAGEAKTFYKSINGDWTIALDTNRKLLITISGVSGTTTNTTAIALSVDTWHVIDVVFDNDCYVYIDGVKETFSIADGNFSPTFADNGVVLNTGVGIKLAQIYGYNNDLTDNQVTTKFRNFTNPYFYEEIGTQETLASFPKEYDGVQMYYKLISSGGWKELLEQGRPVRSFSFYPVNAFVDGNAQYFVVSQSPENQGFLFLARADTFDIADFSHLLLGVLVSNPSKITVQPETADGNLKTYFGYGSANLGEVGDPGDADAYTALSTIQSLSSWRTFLGIGYNSRNRGFIEIWDLGSSVATEKASVGTGNLRIVGNAEDILFCVVDNFIDDAVKSRNKPTMEIRQYIGNGETKTTHRIEIPAIIDDSTYADDWERAVSNMKIRVNTQTLFYARLPKTAAGTTFNEGFWSVGKNSRGELALALQIDTEGLGMPENIFGFAQQAFFIAKDGGIFRLSDNTYNNVALYTTEIMNEGNTEIEKKLYGIELITEPLDSGQTYSVYFKKNGDTERTKICDMTGAGEIAKETTFDEDGLNLPHYQEIEFDIESTGGKAAPLELNYKYEYLSDVI